MTLNYKTHKVPADHSPESIENVFCVLVVEDNRGMGHVKTRIIHLSGNVSNKLKQYEEATGEKWYGFNEKVISIPEKMDEPQSLNLGKSNAKVLPPRLREVQKKLDELSALAAKYIRENEIAKTTPKQTQLSLLSSGEEETSEVS